MIQSIRSLQSISRTLSFSVRLGTPFLLRSAARRGPLRAGHGMSSSAEDISNGCGFVAYSWKLPAYSGAFLLTVDKFSFLLTVGVFLLTALAFLFTVGAFLFTVARCI